jgi:hypothetical protein
MASSEYRARDGTSRMTGNAGSAAFAHGRPVVWDTAIRSVAQRDLTGHSFGSPLERLAVRAGPWNVVDRRYDRRCSHHHATRERPISGEGSSEWLRPTGRSIRSIVRPPSRSVAVVARPASRFVMAPTPRLASPPPSAPSKSRCRRDTAMNLSLTPRRDDSAWTTLKRRIKPLSQDASVATRWLCDWNADDR